MDAYQWLKKQIGLNKLISDNVFEGLHELRNFDKKNPWYFKSE
jgi:hypothetical protein